MIPPLKMCCPFTGTLAEQTAFEKAINSVDYLTATTFRDQVGVICEFLRNDGLNVSYERIGKIFNESKHCIWDQHKNYLRGDKPDGRPCSLTKDEIADILQNITAGHGKTNPIYPTYNDLSYYITQKFNKYIPDDTLRHLFLREYSESFKILESIAKDEDRMNVDIKEIENNLNILKSEVDNVPPDFVFNLDEVGCHDYVDSEKKYVIVPKNFENRPMNHPVARSGKRASAIVCISLTGIACPPQITVPRATVDSQIYKYIPQSSFQIAKSPTGYVNTETFTKWIKEIFLPNLHELRRKRNYYGKAILITDGYLPH